MECGSVEDLSIAPTAFLQKASQADFSHTSLVVLKLTTSLLTDLSGVLD